MIIALFGRSATGKTTVATLMAAELGIPSRHCGTEFRAAAKIGGFTINTAPLEVHREVDRNTVDWCDRLTAGEGVLEGRFLDSVLLERRDVLLFELVSEPSIRVSRWSERLAAPFNLEKLAQVDDADDLFRTNMYATRPPAPARAAVDTSGGLAKEWAAKVQLFVESAERREHG